VLKTRYAIENVPSTVVVEKSPIVTGMSAPPGFARSLATIAFDRSLAQIDASVGGKTAVNLATGKNLVGVFHQPKLVIIDTATLRTLPRRELTAGWCEAVKQGAAGDRKLFNSTVRFLRSCGTDFSSWFLPTRITD